MKAAEVKEALARRHGEKSGEWVGIEEAFCGFQTAGGGIDFFAIGVWRSAKAPGLPGAGRAVINPVVSYEVKVSRSDFRKELYGYEPGPKAKANWRSRPRSSPSWPNKQHFALIQSNYFMFATPKGLLKPEEIEARERPAGQDGEDLKGRPLWLPAHTGLIEVDEAGRCQVTVPAERLWDPPPLTPGAIGELIRHAVKPNKLRNALVDLKRYQASSERKGGMLLDAQEKIRQLEKELAKLRPPPEPPPKPLADITDVHTCHADCPCQSGGLPNQMGLNW